MISEISDSTLTEVPSEEEDDELAALRDFDASARIYDLNPEEDSQILGLKQSSDVDVGYESHEERLEDYLGLHSTVVEQTEWKKRRVEVLSLSPKNRAVTGEEKFRTRYFVEEIERDTMEVAAEVRMGLGNSSWIEAGEVLNGRDPFMDTRERSSAHSKEEEYGFTFAGVVMEQYDPEIDDMVIVHENAAPIASVESGVKVKSERRKRGWKNALAGSQMMDRAVVYGAAPPSGLESRCRLMRAEWVDIEHDR